jgi:hypothetical protein
MFGINPNIKVAPDDGRVRRSSTIGSVSSAGASLGTERDQGRGGERPSRRRSSVTSMGSHMGWWMPSADSASSDHWLGTSFPLSLHIAFDAALPTGSSYGVKGATAGKSLTLHIPLHTTYVDRE